MILGKKTVRRWAKRLCRRVYNWNVRRKNKRRMMGDNKLPANWMAKIREKDKRNRFRRAGTVKSPQQIREGQARNLPCPCGAKDENGKPIKWKNCCMR